MKKSLRSKVNSQSSLRGPSHSNLDRGDSKANNILSSGITEDVANSSDDSDRDEELAAKINAAKQIKMKRKEKIKELKKIKSQIEKEKDEKRARDLRTKYRANKRQACSMDIEFQKIMHVVREMPNGAMQGLAYNCSGASYEPWVRALFDYKPVGKKGHIYFTYDEIIEVYDDNVTIEEKKKKRDKALDFSAFLESTPESEEDEEEEVTVMRGRVIGSDPPRIGLFPSNFVKSVNIPTGDFRRPDEKMKRALFDVYVRGKVSKKKRRFLSGRFDLDLSYITPRIIAMGIPASSWSSLFRNDQDDVIDFFEHFHKDHYQLYNLTDDRAYPTKKFHDRVVQYGFEDHNPCPFDMLEPFCAHLDRWMKESPENIAAIHCKAGKGRTGLMISCYLIYIKQHKTSFAALRYFAVKRTKNCKGVTIPSQMRYVDYFQQYIEEKRSGSLSIPRSKPLRITSIKLSPPPKQLKQGSCMFQVDTFSTMELHEVNQPKKIKHTDRIDLKEGGRIPDAVLKRLVMSDKSIKNVPHDIENSSAHWDLDLNRSIRVDDDVRITFVYRKNFIQKKKLFQVWFNTRFLPTDGKGKGELTLIKPQIDKICKDFKHRAVPKNFKITIGYEKI